MSGHRLYKREKLCSKTAIDILFSPAHKASGENNTIMAYPWRAVWRRNESRQSDVAQFLIIVPKKRLRHAVDRVKMRRRLREAYRLGREALAPHSRVDIAFIYVADKLTPFTDAQRSIGRILSRINSSLTPQQ
ncbi:MAG: ribonuclease P protein component [Bacteroides sp.]|nr:ribonuclease P protein component [Bacteroides sp.]MCM1413828.1 ribonuclease P protein component [Bacteroides sp.]MCM1471228.1 ribonuclease P protein component [Bacteroides sp.]